ncbi:MAG: UDP-N-acetylmuramate--L-alanine ligase [Proteobacteria bacterium]|nr:UDP-N-acetylmuramate--L-alanine ligase [Pseudomonadota bacterium]
MPTSPLHLTPHQPIHFSGIGGSAMNALARLFRSRGHTVTGTDPSLGAAVRARLEAAGIAIFSEQDGRHIPAHTQLLVATAALPTDHPELAAAHARGIPVRKYAEVLGAVMSQSRGIAIAGTHGKTTTSAMTVAALDASALCPEFIIGGLYKDTARCPARDSALFVAEACEFDRSFLRLFPHIAVITNIEAEHLDIYRDLDDILDAFAAFAGNLPPDGTLVYCRDSLTACRVAERTTTCARLSYGLAQDADIRADHLHFAGGRMHFELHAPDLAPLRVSLGQPGSHNVLNALAAFAVGRCVGAHPQALCDGLSAFAGVQRRFDSLGEHRGIHIIDDYAHHPTELRMLLAAARQRHPDRRRVVLFQPHQVSRTRQLFGDFCAAFADVDLALVTDVFAARDGLSAENRTVAQALAEGIQGQGTPARYLPTSAALAQKLVAEVLREGDVFVTAGAGNVDDIARQVCALLRDAP